MKKAGYINKLIYLLAIILSIGLLSCGKDGDLGPMGPPGERGQQGEQGQRGEPGTDGSAVLSGATDPKDSDGKDGDFYVNINTYEMYGPKKDNSWGNAKSLLGAKGDKGDTGSKGEKGEKGDKGDTGPKGEKGEKGDKGDTGPKGEKGEKGDKGDTGPKGEKGEKGDKGDTGPKGEKGEKGDKGDTGPKGEKGEKGDKGDTEYELLGGSTDPTFQGKLGDFYYQTESKTLFRKERTTLISGYPIIAWQKVGKLSSTIQFTKSRISVRDHTEITLNLPKEVFEKSAVSVYLTDAANTTTLLPDYYGSSGTYFSVQFSHPDEHRTTLKISRATGTASLTLATIRVLVTEADVFNLVAKSINFNNYDEVKHYFNLQN